MKSSNQQIGQEENDTKIFVEKSPTKDGEFIIQKLNYNEIARD